jgi:hypothetical protein
MTGIMGQIQGAVSAGVLAIQGVFSGLVAGAQGALATIQGLFAQAQSAVAQIGQGIVAVTKPATDQFQNLFNQAAQGITGAAEGLWNWLVGGSIWPEMFGTMESITSQSMAAIQNTVSSGMASAVASAKAGLTEIQGLVARAAAMMQTSPGLSSAQYQAMWGAQESAAGAIAKTAAATVPAAGAGGVFGGMWEPTTPMNLSGAGMADFGQKLADAIFAATIGRSPYGPGGVAMPATAQEMLKATLPISVIVDGVTVSRVTEQRMITQRQLAGQYGA